jgi:hypothetical protein
MTSIAAIEINFILSSPTALVRDYVPHGYQSTDFNINLQSCRSDF